MRVEIPLPRFGYILAAITDWVQVYWGRGKTPQKFQVRGFKGGYQNFVWLIIIFIIIIITKNKKLENIEKVSPENSIKQKPIFGA